MLKVGLITLLALAPAAVVATGPFQGDTNKPAATVYAASFIDGGRRGEDKQVTKLGRIFRDQCYPAGGELCCAEAETACLGEAPDQVDLCAALKRNCVTGGFISGK